MRSYWGAWPSLHPGAIGHPMATITLLCALLVLSAWSGNARAQDILDSDWMINATDKATAVLQTQKYKVALGSLGDPVGAAMRWWGDFKRTHNKGYASKSDEDNARAAFLDNLRAIAQVNNDPSTSHWLGPNEYSDMSFSQLKDRMLMRVDGNRLKTNTATQRRSVLGRRKVLGLAGYPGARQKDWVAAKRVTPVKNQGLCGSCWAFAATTAVEAAYCIAKGIDAAKTTKVLLSEQQLVDCTNSAYGWWSNGCFGGYSDEAFDYILMQNQTIDSRYPYQGFTQSCNFTATAAPTGQVVQLTSTTGSTNYPLQNDVISLMLAVDKGPVVVYLEASWPMVLYSGGIFVADGVNCGTNVNHAVTVVGYVWKGDWPGSYWIIQNSWGTSWGENGRIKIAMQPPGPGPCGMYQYPMQPKNTFAKFLA